MKRFTLAVVLGIVIIVASLAIWAIFNQVLAAIVVVLATLFYAVMILIAGAHHLGRRSPAPVRAGRHTNYCLVYEGFRREDDDGFIPLVEIASLCLTHEIRNCGLV